MSASVSLDLTETITFAALRGWLLTRLASTVAIVKGQVNRVSEPSGSDYIVMWPLTRPRLGTNFDSYFADDNSPLPDVKLILQPTQLDIQLDVHGPNSADNTQIIAALFRDEDATSYFRASGYNMQALYASDPRQMEFDDAEAQAENRWTIDLSLQINPTVTVPQQFSDVVTPAIVNVEAAYPIQ